MGAFFVSSDPVIPAKKKRPRWRFLRYTLTIIAHDAKKDAPERF